MTNFLHGGKGETKMKRDPGVEFMRILACLMVIGIHTALYAQVDGSWIFSRVFFNCIVADGVAVFFMIIGFFLFQSRSYERILKRTWKNLGIPVVLYSIFGFLFFGWLLDGEKLSVSICFSPEKYKTALKTLLSWNNPVPHSDHLWYIYVYVFLMLLFPVLKCFVDYLDEDRKRTQIFLIATFGFFVLNDISGNTLGAFAHHSINGAFPAAIEMIWGHILYRNRGKFTKKWIPAAGMGFLFVNMIRAVIQRWQYRIDGQPSCVIFWFSAMGLFCAVCVACFCLALFQGEKKESRGKRMICQIASCTFMIYLLHMAVRDFLSHMGYQDWLNAVILGRLPGKAGMVLYMMAIMGSIFGISLLLSVLLGIPGRLIKNIRK